MDLLINTYGTKIGASGERIILSLPKIKKKEEYTIRRIEKIVILRPASITTHAVKLALDHDVDIVYLGAFGKPVGRIFSSEPGGLATLRKAQLDFCNASEKSFSLAKLLAKGKCANQIAHMKHMAKKYRKDFAKEIMQAETILKPSTISKKVQGGQNISKRYWRMAAIGTCLSPLKYFL